MRTPAFMLLSLAATMFFLCGCSFISAPDTAKTDGASTRPWKEAQTYTTETCVVKTNTSLQTAEYIGRLMNDCIGSYRQLLGGAELPPVTLNVYASAGQFRKMAARYGIEHSGGIYIPSANTIYLPYVNLNNQNPTEVLLHETMHYYLHHAYGYPVPQKFRKIVGKEKLVSVPLWLQEGLATYAEASNIWPGGLEMGILNKKRQKELKILLRRNKPPFVKRIISTPFGKAYTSSFYAVSWGLAYTTLNCPELEERNRLRLRLRRYLELCRSGFMDNTKDFERLFLVKGKLAKDFYQRWKGHVANKGAEAFESIFASPEGGMKRWERLWIKTAYHMK